MARIIMGVVLWTLILTPPSLPAAAGKENAGDSGTTKTDAGENLLPVVLEESPPEWGVEFGIGFPMMTVRSDALNVDLEAGRPASSGVMLHMEGLFGNLRAGYVRHLFRRTLPEQARFEGVEVDFLAFDADQLWGFHGFRPFPSLYLGYGLGWERLLLRLENNGSTQFTRSESGFLAGLMADWVMADPFALQLRWFRDLNGRELEKQGASLQLSYVVEY